MINVANSSVQVNMLMTKHATESQKHSEHNAAAQITKKFTRNDETFKPFGFWKTQKKLVLRHEFTKDCNGSLGVVYLGICDASQQV